MRKLFFIVSLIIASISSSFAGSLEMFADSKQHFSPEWGDLVRVEQTVALNAGMAEFVPAYSLHFQKGFVMPVVVIDGEKIFGSAEPDEGQGFNSALYSLTEERWVNAVATDYSEEYEHGMTWTSTNEVLEASAEFALSKGITSVMR